MTTTCWPGRDRVAFRPPTRHRRPPLRGSTNPGEGRQTSAASTWPPSVTGASGVSVAGHPRDRAATRDRGGECPPGAITLGGFPHRRRPGARTGSRTGRSAPGGHPSPRPRGPTPRRRRGRTHGRDERIREPHLRRVPPARGVVRQIEIADGSRDGRAVKRTRVGLDGIGHVLLRSHPAVGRLPVVRHVAPIVRHIQVRPGAAAVGSIRRTAGPRCRSRGAPPAPTGSRAAGRSPPARTASATAPT